MKGIQYLIAFVIITVAASIAFLLERWLLPSSGTVLLLQLGVLLVALVGQFAPAVFATLLGVFYFNFLFTAPRFSLHMSEPDEIATITVFCIIALATSHLASSFRAQRNNLRQTQLRATLLLSLSHDLRTPLASIIGTLSTYQTYRDKLSTHENNELIQGALNESERLHHYIENLLQATRLQHRHKLNLVMLEHELEPLIQAVIQRFTASPQRNRLQVTFADVDIIVKVKGALFQQAVYNLLDNALRFSPASEKVELAVAYTHTHATITISDRGPGIPKADQTKIFDLFFSTRQGDTGRGGTGLGLPVAASIIEAHAGKVALVPTREGCTFCITLPAYHASEKAN